MAVATCRFPPRTPRALTALVGLSGCVAHGGATVGIRPGNRTLSFGWQLGAGSYVEVLVGQSYASGRAFNYGAVHGWLPVRDTAGNGNGWDHHETHLGARPSSTSARRRCGSQGD